MSAVEEYRKWWGVTEGWTRLEGALKADAAIAELEAMLLNQQALAQANVDLKQRAEQAEADNRILTAELRGYFQQYGWESTERILKYHGSDRGTQ